MDDLVDHAGAQRGAWREGSRGEDELERARQADQARQPLGPAGAGKETEADLGEAEPQPGQVGRDAPVARQRDLVRAAERRSADGGDGGAGKRGEVVENLLQPAHGHGELVRGSLSDHLEVRAGDELPGLAADDE